MVAPSAPRSGGETSYRDLVTTAALLALVAPTEHRFGVARTGLLLLITQVVGVLAGSPIVKPGSLAGVEWTEHLAAAAAAGASPAAIGVGLATAGMLSALRRRRLRLLILAAMLTKSYLPHLTAQQGTRLASSGGNTRFLSLERELEVEKRNRSPFSVASWGLSAFQQQEKNADPA